jgi:hypothetical protein
MIARVGIATTAPDLDVAMIPTPRCRLPPLIIAKPCETASEKQGKWNFGSRRG